jgi:hypothetical protein
MQLNDRDLVVAWKLGKTWCCRSQSWTDIHRCRSKRPDAITQPYQHANLRPQLIVQCCTVTDYFKAATEREYRPETQPQRYWTFRVPPTKRDLPREPTP